MVNCGMEFPAIEAGSLPDTPALFGYAGRESARELSDESHLSCVYGCCVLADGNAV